MPDDIYSNHAGAPGWRPSLKPGPDLPPAWQTTAFTALPAGWINTYTDSAGTIRTERSPGVLLQQCTRTTDGHRKGATRTVYAANDAAGQLIPAADHPDYAHTQPENQP